MQMKWLHQSSLTFENVALSSRLLRAAVGSGIGFRVTEQEIKCKYLELLQAYTSGDKLTAIEQLFTLLQVATLGPTHQFSFGFIIWAPKTVPASPHLRGGTEAEPSVFAHCTRY